MRVRVMQPEIVAGQVHIMRPGHHSSWPASGYPPQFVADAGNDYLVSIIGNEKVAVPIYVDKVILSQEQMEAVMVRVALTLVALETAKPGRPV